MIKYGIETFEGTCREAFPLLIEHWKEVKSHPTFVLSPDIEGYRRLEADGKLCVVCARDDETLIGYIVFIVSRHLHYDVIVAVDDIHYIKPEYRKGRNGVNLFKAAEEALRRMGVQAIFMRTKAAPEHNHGRIFEWLDYTVIDHNYLKVL